MRRRRRLVAELCIVRKTGYRSPYALGQLYYGAVEAPRKFNRGYAPVVLRISWRYPYDLVREFNVPYWAVKLTKLVSRYDH